MTYKLLAQIKINPADIGVARVDNADNALAGILNTVYIWTGIVAVLVIIVAGFYFVTSSDDPSLVKRAREAIIGAVIGLIVVIGAFVATQFIIGRF